MINDRNIAQAKMLYIVLHGSPVRLTVFYCDHGPLRCLQCCFNGNALPADNTQIILLVYHHLVQDHSTDLASYITDRSTLEHVIVHSYLRSVTRLWIQDQHTC